MYLKFIVSTGTNFYLNKETQFLEKFPCLFTTSNRFPVTRLGKISTSSFSQPRLETIPCVWPYCSVAGWPQGWAGRSRSAWGLYWLSGALGTLLALSSCRCAGRAAGIPSGLLQRAGGCWWTIEGAGKTDKLLWNLFCHLSSQKVCVLSFGFKFAL